MMWVVGVLMAAVLSLVVTWLLFDTYRHQLGRMQTEGLALMQVLRELLSHIQKHRGLSSGYLSGDHSVLVNIKSIQSAALRDIRAIERMAPVLESDSRWQNITQHWARLSAGFEKNTVSNNLEQHSRLIQGLLFLIEDTAERHQLYKLHHAEVDNLRFIWKELLGAAECIGQARAIGTGVATVGRCDSVARIRLRYLQQRIEQTSQQALVGLPHSEKHQHSIQDLLQCISDQLLAEQPTISPDQYFLRCSEVIDGLYELYDRTIGYLRETSR